MKASELTHRVSLFALGGAFWLAGCVEQSVVSAPPEAGMSQRDLAHESSTASGRPLGEAVRQRKRLAERYQASGDLVAAATQWHILTLIAPDDATFARQLAAVRSEISRAVADSYETGISAFRQGNTDQAARSMLRVLALAPDHSEAAQVMREIEKEKMARIQTAHSARARRDEGIAGNGGAPARERENGSRPSYDLEQALNIFAAGDVSGGLREMRRYVEANPDDAVARQRISTAIYERAGKLYDQGAREQALGLYEQAVSLRGDTPSSWNARIKALRKALASEYYDKGVRVYHTNIALAAKYLQISLRYDPQNVNAALRLKEAEVHQDRLKRIEDDKSQH